MRRTLLFSFLVSSSALADFHGPLLVVTQTQPDLSATQCRIYPDKVQKDRTVGDGLRSSETRKVQVDLKGVNREIDRAAEGHLTTRTGTTATAASTYKALQIGSDGTPKVVVLEQQKGSENLVNDSTSAVALKQFIDQNCQ